MQWVLDFEDLVQKENVKYILNNFFRLTGWNDNIWMCWVNTRRYWHEFHRFIFTLIRLLEYVSWHMWLTLHFCWAVMLVAREAWRGSWVGDESTGLEGRGVKCPSGTHCGRPSLDFPGLFSVVTWTVSQLGLRMNSEGPWKAHLLMNCGCPCNKPYIYYTVYWYFKRQIQKLAHFRIRGWCVANAFSTQWITEWGWVCVRWYG